jgi:hypothetical protein
MTRRGWHYGPCAGAARSLASSLPRAVFVFVAALAWWEIAGPAWTLIPLALVGAVIGAVVAVKVHRLRGGRLNLPVGLAVVRSDRLLTCRGCGWREAIAVLTWRGATFPVCRPCQSKALTAFATGQLTLPASPRERAPANRRGRAPAR